MPFLLAEILNFQGSTHLIGVGSLSYGLFGTRYLSIKTTLCFKNRNEEDNIRF